MKIVKTSYRQLLQEVCADAKKETVRLLLDNGLTELSLSKDCDTAYATFCDENNHCIEHVVTDIKLHEDDGEFDIAFKIEGSDEWFFYFEVRDEVAVNIYEVVGQTLELF